VDALLATVNRFQLGRATAIVALGDTMKRRLVEGKGADPALVQVIENWADCRAIVPGDRQSAFASANGLAGRFVVMHAGNLGLSQDLDTALDAAALVGDRDDILFVFVGGGVRQAELQARVAREGLANVRFVPHQPKEAMGPWYAASDVSLISLRRGLAGVIVPSKTYSALAAGRPCIAAVEADCEIAPLVRDAGCGLVIEPHDAAALAGAVTALAADPAAAARMGHQAREAALRFDRARQVARYDALLRSVVAR
jgi:colanic acid biosynthesis glycosyl transferase WcaI